MSSDFSYGREGARSRERSHSPAVWVHMWDHHTMYSRLVAFCNASGHYHEDCRAELRTALEEGGKLKVLMLS